jgi:spermidine/putrescine transport system substrate-binding protein
MLLELARRTGPRALVLVLALSLATLACGGQGSAPEVKEIAVYSWSEYIDPDIPKQFEAATGIQVRMDFFEATEDMMAKLKQGGAGQYDVLVIPDHSIPVLAELKLIAPLDKAQVPNAANVSARFSDPPYDRGNVYSLPYQWGTVGLMYRKDRLPNLEPTWKAVFEQPPGPFVLIDSMRDMLGIALVAAGHSLNSRDKAEIGAAGERVLAAKRHASFVGFEGGVGGKGKVLSGAASLAIVYNGDALRAMEEDPNTAFVVPAEGSIVWVDAMAISAQAPHREAAHRFVNYILDAQVGAQLSNYNRYPTPNEAALAGINADDKADPAIYPPPEVMTKLQFLEDVGDATRLYDEVWTSVKAR